MGQNIDDKDLIKETYAASLQPERLAAFEDFWEAYLDLRLNKKDLQKIDEGFLQSHFSMALSIVERIRHEREEEDYFHRLVMSHPGMASIPVWQETNASNPSPMLIIMWPIWAKKEPQVGTILPA